MLNLVNTTAQRLVQLELLNFLGDLVWIREEKRGQRVILELQGLNLKKSGNFVVLSRDLWILGGSG